MVLFREFDSLEKIAGVRTQTVKQVWKILRRKSGGGSRQRLLQQAWKKATASGDHKAVRRIQDQIQESIENRPSRRQQVQKLLRGKRYSVANQRLAKKLQSQESRAAANRAKRFGTPEQNRWLNTTGSDKALKKIQAKVKRNRKLPAAEPSTAPGPGPRYPAVSKDRVANRRRLQEAAWDGSGPAPRAKEAPAGKRRGQVLAELQSQGALPGNTRKAMPGPPGPPPPAADVLPGPPRRRRRDAFINETPGKKTVFTSEADRALAAKSGDPFAASVPITKKAPAQNVPTNASPVAARSTARAAPAPGSLDPKLPAVDVSGKGGAGAGAPNLGATNTKTQTSGTDAAAAKTQTTAPEVATKPPADPGDAKRDRILGVDIDAAKKSYMAALKKGGWARAGAIGAPLAAAGTAGFVAGQVAQ
jgi:hypothetical protein